jgi:Cys-rich protein (TIGR01571 family)
MIFFFPPFILFLVYVFVAAYYKEKLRKKYGADVTKWDSLHDIDMRQRDFDTGLFDCFNGHKSVRKCCFACFCPPVRWSADASSTGFMEFWVALILSSIFITVMFVFGFIGRIHIRASNDMEKGAVGDFFSWLCCYSCALTQEAKFVDKGYRAIRDGAQVTELEAQPVRARIVDKPSEARPPTPATTGSGSPEPPPIRPETQTE